ncbi:STM4504/CBY_0614 family protein [Pantoea eucrina]|uniref:STM4504/CBY_0614 family protein n=1 Tax=Pantoea eucrina TaxID=472693 RepID=UPI001CC642A1|nr:hypothetical protein [Pantoea eucrina]UBB13650.1 hypothetical protein LAC65_02060 [Pantoea eucrina]
MTRYKLYSERQKALRTDVSDVYQYTEFPDKLRYQILTILDDILEGGGRLDYSSTKSDFYFPLYKTLCREYGEQPVIRLELMAKRYLEDIIENEKDSEKFLDVIDLMLSKINSDIRKNSKAYGYTPTQIDEYIEELNHRFMQAGVGFQFENGEIIKFESQLMHTEATKPILQILGSNPNYKGVNDEFLSAHEHYRNRRYKECLNDCLKSFESLMKAIHTKHEWPFEKSAAATKLIEGCYENKLIPEYMKNGFTGLRTLLSSSIPTIRNKESGHGQGHEVKIIPEHLASYSIHMTASTLLFLAKCEEQL